MQKLWNGLKISMTNPQIWLESTKSQWQTLPWLVKWLGSPPWLNAQIKPLKPLTDPLNPRPVKKIKMGEFFPSTREFFPKTRPSFSPKTRQKLVFLKNSRVSREIASFSRSRVLRKKSVKNSDNFFTSFWRVLWKNSGVFGKTRVKLAGRWEKLTRLKW